jgi:hypothetical protein
MSRSDPGATSGGPIDTTRPANCGCGHIQGVHTPRPSNQKIRAACTAHDPAACPCRSYQPEPEP